MTSQWSQGSNSGTRIGKIVKMAIDCKCSSGRFLHQLLTQRPNYDYLQQSRENVPLAIMNSVSTRRVTYKSLIPGLTSSAIYSCVRRGIIPEYKCIAFTRMCLSSHYLHIETGMWACLPREDRMCVCGDSIQRQRKMSSQNVLSLPLTATLSVVRTVQLPVVKYQ